MRILIPVDGSKHSMAAVRFVAARSTQEDGSPQIELLNVQAALTPHATRVLGKAACNAYYEDEADKVLQPSLRVLNKAGLDATARYEVGHAVQVIAKTASASARGKKNSAPDLLVMGTHGHGVLRRLLLGSITTGVLANTTTPLLLVHEKVPEVDATLKVALALDGSAFGLKALRYLLKQRALFGNDMQLKLVHVVPDFRGANPPDLAGVAMPAFTVDEIKTMQDQSFENAMAPARKLLKRSDLDAEEVRLVGAAADNISSYARKKKIDVLVLGSHGHGALRQVVLGSVATRVAAQCATPLLIVR